MHRNPDFLVSSSNVIFAHFPPCHPCPISIWLTLLIGSDFEAFRLSALFYSLQTCFIPFTIYRTASPALPIPRTHPSYFYRVSHSNTTIYGYFCLWNTHMGHPVPQFGGGDLGTWGLSAPQKVTWSLIIIEEELKRAREIVILSSMSI